MKTFVAVASMTLGIAAACGTGTSPRTGAPPVATATKALVACHRAGEPRPAVGAATAGTRRDDRRDIRRRAARPRAIDPGHLILEVAARMPRHDGVMHRQLATAIQEEAKRAGLDPLLVLALIDVESSFNPSAVSYAGAVGLMQLRARTLQRELERSGLAPADPRDPVANVRAGVRYLHRLVSAFGSTDLALMAYNAGPNRILGYYRAGAIPDRFHVYPRRVRGAVERFRIAIERRSRKAGNTSAGAPAAPAAA